MNSRKGIRSSKTIKKATAVGSGGKTEQQYAGEYCSTRQSAACAEPAAGIQSYFESVFQNVFGSCGSVVEAASYLVKNGFTQDEEEPPLNSGFMPQSQQQQQQQQQHGLSSRTPRKPAPQSSRPEPADIPSHLGASFGFDDSISALSAYTLEEMARLQAKAAQRGKNIMGGSPLTSDSETSIAREKKKRRDREERMRRFSPPVVTTKDDHRSKPNLVGISCSSSSSSEYMAIWDVAPLDNGR